MATLVMDHVLQENRARMLQLYMLLTDDSIVDLVHLVEEVMHVINLLRYKNRSITTVLMSTYSLILGHNTTVKLVEL